MFIPCLTLMEEHIRGCLRRTFGPKREEVAGGWRRMHDEELHNLYASPNIMKVIRSRTRWARHVAEMRNAYKILVVEPEGKTPCGRPRHRWADNTRMDVREMVGRC